MKLLLLFAASVLIGCGMIFGLVNGIVPHLVAPQFLPEARAGARDALPLHQSLADAGDAVRTGVESAPREQLASNR